MTLQQEFYTVSEAAAKLGLSEHAVVDLTEIERLNICFKFGGEVDTISRTSPDSVDNTLATINFKGVLKCLQPPTTENGISEWGVLVSVLRSDTLCIKTGQTYRLPTVDPLRGYLKPGHEAVGFVEANVPRAKWLFHIDDLNLIIEASGRNRPAGKPMAGGEWVALAQTRAREIIKRQRDLDYFPDQIAVSDEIAKEFRTTGIFGTDGKPLSGAYIKRHALKGISSATDKQLSTVIVRGK